MPHWLKVGLRIAITVLILWAMLRAIDHQQTWSILQHADFSLLLLALLAQFASTTIAAYRWQVIMQNLHFGLAFKFYWRSYFKGMFFNQALPTSIGGDAVKVLDLVRKKFRKRDAIYGVMVDRVIGLAALLFLSLLAYLFERQHLPAKINIAIILLNLCAISGFFALLHMHKLHWLQRVPKLYELLVNVSDWLRLTFRTDKLLILITSLLIPFLAVLGFYFTGRALGMPFALTTYFLVIPPAIVFTVIPVSIAGWGVREGALVALFGLLGGNQSAVLMMSITYGFTLILVSLPGLFIFLAGRQRLHA